MAITGSQKKLRRRTALGGARPQAGDNASLSRGKRAEHRAEGARSSARAVVLRGTVSCSAHNPEAAVATSRTWLLLLLAAAAKF